MFYDWRVTVGFVPYGLIRAICDMSLGAYGFVLVEHLKSVDCKKIYRIILSLCELLGWGTLVLSTQYVEDGKSQVICILIAWGILIITISNISYLNLFLDKINLSKLSIIGFSVYMTHYVSIKLVSNWYRKRPYWHNLPLFLTICILSALFEILIVKMIDAYIQSKS